MRNVIHVLVTLLMICGKALALSGVFTFFHWLLSLIGVSPKPTIPTFLSGAAVLAIFFIIRGVVAVVRLRQQMKNDEYFKWLNETKGVTWEQYLRVYKPVHDANEHDRRQEQGE